jgi:hypothetical protein
MSWENSDLRARSRRQGAAIPPPLKARLELSLHSFQNHLFFLNHHQVMAVATTVRTIASS